MCQGCGSARWHQVGFPLEVGRSGAERWRTDFKLQVDNNGADFPVESFPKPVTTLARLELVFQRLVRKGRSEKPTRATPARVGDNARIASRSSQPRTTFASPVVVISSDALGLLPNPKMLPYLVLWLNVLRSGRVDHPVLLPHSTCHWSLPRGVLTKRETKTIEIANWRRCDLD